MSEGLIGRITKKFSEPEKKTGSEYTKEQALEVLMLVAAAGPEGQREQQTFQEGSTIILNRFDPGTVIREEYKDWHRKLDESEAKFLYVWWVVGDYNKASNSLTLFAAHGPDGNSSCFSRHILPEPYTVAVQHKIKATERNGDVTHLIGTKGMMSDTYLEQMAKDGVYKNPDPILGLRESRRTTSMDVIKFGTPVKEREPEQVDRRQAKLVQAQKPA